MGNVLEVSMNHDNEDMEVTLGSFYKNMKALKEKGVDDGLIAYFKKKVDSILKMAESVKGIENAKNKNDGEAMKIALHSFYGNRNAFIDNGIDENLLKNFDDKVDTILVWDKKVKRKKRKWNTKLNLENS